MSKPKDIPQDVWDAAVGWIHSDWDKPAEAIARAIIAAKAEERGACAALATNFATTSNTRDVNLIMQEAAAADTAEGIAEAIRKRGEPL